MSDDIERNACNTARRNNGAPDEEMAHRRPFVQPIGSWLSHILCLAGRRGLLPGLILAAIPIYSPSANSSPERTLLPIEVLGADGTTVSRTVTIQREQAESVHSLWVQINGLRYTDEGSIQVNTGTWIPLNNSTVTVAEPGKSFGGIGGFATLAMTLPIASGTVTSGTNTIRFRFNRTDGVSSGYRVLAWNFLTVDGTKLLPPDDFAEDAPETWMPPLPDADSIQSGRQLWQTASLTASSLPDSPRIQAHCADCHAQDGRDLKYFNFSNHSIITRAQFHGLSARQGEQIASYIRSLPFPNPGRPWNPPYQPGPGLDEQPVSSWAAGAGLAWVVDRDADALPYLFSQHTARMSSAALDPSRKVADVRELVRQVSPDVFRPDGNLNPREIPIALQLPDWNQWLPHVHPKDAWGPAFTDSGFGEMYVGGTSPNSKSKLGGKTSLRTLLSATRSTDHDIRPLITAFAQWSKARHAFLKRVVKANTAWSPTLSDQVYSMQLWQLVKTWEMMQEFGLEERGHDFFGPIGDTRTWCNTVPGETAPSAAHIPDGPAGVGGSALTNEYFTASWYELQVLLNSGNHQHSDRSPVDWIYLIGRFRDLYVQTHQPEPARLLVAVIKALQSTDPRFGPTDLRRGWRPDQNIDPRIMVSPAWAPIFKPLPAEVHRALTTALLTAWMDKNQQYTVAQYLPLGLRLQNYVPSRAYGDVSGGNVWQSARQFRDAGIPADLLDRLVQWGIAFTDRAARLQYEGASSSKKM